MLRVGITGGIGSGKSTVCNIFKQLGIAVYNADTRVKELYETDAALVQTIANNLGNELLVNGKLDLQKLKQKVFTDAQMLGKLNAVVHPAVFEDYENWCLAHQNEIYTLKEAAIMFESGSNEHVHKIIGVVAPEAVKIARVQQRDGLSEEQIRDRMHKQLAQEELIKRCDYIIENDGSQSLIEQVMKLHNLFLQSTEKR